VKKKERLKQLLTEIGSCAITFSGGVDSTLLLKVAADVLGDRVLALTAVSPLYPRRELDEAKQLAYLLGVRQRLVDVNPMDVPEFTYNPPDRCYLCKSHLFTKLVQVAAAEGFFYMCDGSNADDRRSYRPGMKALVEMQVRSPLLEAGLTKDDIRALSRRLGLPTWNKPAKACFATRFPYGEEITLEKLARVEQAEDYLNSFSYKNLRVRCHEGIARIEVDPESFVRVVNKRQQIVNTLKNIGFKYITLDLEGFCSGSMDRSLRGELNE